MICNELFSVINHGYGTLTLLPAIVSVGWRQG